MTTSPTALQRIADAAHRHPDRPCLIVADDELTHDEVDRLSATVARGLIGSGIDRGDRVVVVSPNHLLTMVATLGIIRAGATWIPLNPRDSVETISELCRRFGADVVIYHRDFSGAVAQICATAATVTATLPLDDLLRWADGFDQTVALVEPPLDALAAIFATGGTTGIPKGVCFSYKTLSAIIGNFVELLDHADPVFLAAGPLSHVSGRACLGTMAAGGTTVVLTQFDAGEALNAIERRRVTVMVLPTTMLTRLVAHPAASTTDSSSLRRVSVGASPVPIDVLKKAIATFGPVVAQNYGQTEAPMHISSMRPDEYLIDGTFVVDARMASCGRATPVCEIRIVSVEGAEVAAGEVGEIVVRGNFVMDGYLDDEAGTLATRIDGFHRTGDLGMLDAEGYLTIVGRLKQMVITGGFNVYPAEIESVLAERPEVYESAVIGLTDADWGERLVAVIELTEGASYDAEELRQFVHARLGGVKTPKQFIVVDELPRNANGKILKNDLVRRLTANP